MIKLDLQFFGGRGGNSGKQEIQNVLQNLPEHEFGRGKVLNPIPIAQENIIKQANSIYFNLSDKELTSRTSINSISISRLETDQSWVRKSSLIKLNENIKGNISGINTDDNVTVFKYNGHFIVFDGNHRTSLALLRNQKTIKAKVINLD